MSFLKVILELMCEEHAFLFGFCVKTDGLTSFKVTGSEGLHRNPKGFSGHQPQFFCMVSSKLLAAQHEFRWSSLLGTDSLLLEANHSGVLW